MQYGRRLKNCFKTMLRSAISKVISYAINYPLIFENQFRLKIEVVAMEFSLQKSTEVLERTPHVLFILLDGISAEWILNNEGGETWSVYDVMGHLIHGEETDWMIRAEQIISGNKNEPFKPFDRFAQFENSKGKNLNQLLNQFNVIRKANLQKLSKLRITDTDLNKTCIHPTFGKVSLSQLLATWVAHDLNHISQIARVMAKQYKEEVGPWVAYLKILQ